MVIAPPAGSNITVRSDGPTTIIEIPYKEAGVARYGMSLFLLFWLGMWTIGFQSALSKILAGGDSAFLIFWLCGWTVGGIYAVYTLYRMLRPSIPETLRLNPRTLAYDSGVQPLQLTFGHNNQRDHWKVLFAKRKAIELDNRTLQSLHLRVTSDGNRLTFDANADRIDIARSASEIEREWLYQQLAGKYGLPKETQLSIDDN